MSTAPRAGIGRDVPVGRIQHCGSLKTATQNILWALVYNGFVVRMAPSRRWTLPVVSDGGYHFWHISWRLQAARGWSTSSLHSDDWWLDQSCCCEVKVFPFGNVICKATGMNLNVHVSTQWLPHNGYAGLGLAWSYWGVRAQELSYNTNCLWKFLHCWVIHVIHDPLLPSYNRSRK